MRNSGISTLLRSKNTVFTFKDIALLWRNTNANLLKRRIHHYTSTGSLYQIRRGIYAKDEHYDRLELATKIYTPSYIGLETVLQKEGVVFQHYNKIFVVTYLTREIKCDGQTYVFRKIKDTVLTNTIGLERRENYTIASRERAFLDVLYLYKNYHFDNLQSLNWDVCFRIIPIYDSKILAKRLDSYYKHSDRS
jgi:hypothetical protein